jgi:hypothetical protein
MAADVNLTVEGSVLNLTLLFFATFANLRALRGQRLLPLDRYREPNWHHPDLLEHV